MREVYIGWPKYSGVIVLKSDESFMTCDVGRMVTSMKGKCRVLRDRLDAVYYVDIRTDRGFASLGPRKVKARKLTNSKRKKDRKY